jgi:hypothetical protein
MKAQLPTLAILIAAAAATVTDAGHACDQVRCASWVIT